MFLTSFTKEKFADFLASVPVPIAVFDTEMKFLLCSERWYEAFDVTPELLLGKSLFDVNKMLPPHWRVACDEALSGAQVSRDMDFFPRVNGREDWLRWTIKPWYGDNNKIGGAIVFAEVITDQVKLREQEERYKIQLEETVLERTADLDFAKQISEAYALDLERKASELLQAKQIADEASHIKSQFLANMSHELRTPLNSIIGLNKILSKSEMTDDQAELVSIVNQSAQNMLALVNDILDLAKIEADGISLENKPFDIVDEVSNAVLPLQALALEKEVVIRTQYPDDQDFYYMGDKLRIRQIVTNLVGNAIKYTEKGSVTIHLSVEERNGKDEVKIIVQDTGVGIPKEILPKVFDKFIQADDSGTKKYGGTGLGLSITKELVLRMGGTISVESVVGKGSQFIIELPMTRASEDAFLENIANTEKKHIQVGKIPAHKVRVLVAEDHSYNQVLIDRLLNQLGITNFKIAADGLESFSSWKSEDFDLIIMDCSMPILSGFDVTHQIRTEEMVLDRHIPIIALTANAMAGDRQACLDAGMDEYLSKPIDEAALLQVLSKWIDFGEIKAVKPPVLRKSPNKANKQIVDITVLQGYAERDAATEIQLARIFMDQSSEIMSQMTQAAQKSEPAEWQSLAHKLKGGAKGIGANGLADLCHYAQHSEDISLKRRLDIQKELQSHYTHVQNYLDNYIKMVSNGSSGTC